MLKTLCCPLKMIGQEQRAAVDVSTYHNSRDLIRDTETVVGSILERYSDLILPKFFRYIIGKEVALALRNFGEIVLAGKGNTDISHEAGITLYTTSRGKERLFERAAIWPDAIEDEVRNITDLMWELRFPNGVYVMAGGGAQFFQEASEKWSEQGGAKKPFTLSYNEVVRVEGDSGEMWQNKDYNWDGSLKRLL